MRRVFGIHTCDEVGWWLYPRTPVAQGGKNALNWGWAPGDCMPGSIRANVHFGMLQGRTCIIRVGRNMTTSEQHGTLGGMPY